MATTLPSDLGLLQLPPAPQDMAWIVLGPRFAGWGLKLVLYGIALAAFVHYVRVNFAQETRGMKALVSTVMILQTIETGEMFSSMMMTGVSQRRDVLWLIRFSVIDAIVFPSALCSFLVQVYLARRVCLFASPQTLSWALAIAFGLGIAAAFASYVALGGTDMELAFSAASQLARRPGRLPAFDVLAMAFAASAITDTLISASLVVLLLRNMHGLNKRSYSVLRKIIWMTIATASYTAVVAVIGAILGFALKDSPYSEAAAPFYLILPNLYTLSLFSTSIFRRRIRQQARGGFTPPTLPTIPISDPKAPPTEGAQTLGMRTEESRFGPSFSDTESGSDGQVGAEYPARRDEEGDVIEPPKWRKLSEEKGFGNLPPE